MCGINGLFGYSKGCLHDGQPLVQAMNRSVGHRGPDGTGVWSDDRRGVCLGHRRLAIIDPTPAGDQPMVSPTGVAIVSNGEIFNYRSLKAEVLREDCKSETDTEVLLYLFEKFGRDCLDLLSGMFSFAVWDPAAGELFLARDRIGIKPLYYASVMGVFAFSSEVRALLTLPWIRAELDEDALYDFLTFNKLAPPQTMFRGIHKFHPGHYMSVGRGGIREYRPYWEVSYSDYESLDEEEIKELILHELERAVRENLVSDVPLGVFLSGGVDSSSIVAMMSRCSPGPVRTYSIGFEGAPGYDERDHALKVSERFGTAHVEKIITRQDMVDFLPVMADIFDEPLADAASIPIYFLARIAREDGTAVVLTGDGADETFCGYRKWLRYVSLYPCYRMISRLPEDVLLSASGMMGRIRPGSAASEMLSRAARREEFFWGGAGGFKESAKRSFLSSGFIERMASRDSYQRVSDLIDRFESIPKGSRKGHYVDRLCFMGLLDIVPNYYLHRADRLGMAHAVELRVPFLDHTLVNLAMSVPGRMKIRHGVPKYILKKSMEGVLPPEILYRRKMGFCVPLREWARDIMVDDIERNLSRFCSGTGMFNEESLRSLVERTKNGKADHVFSLWNIYFLMSWFKRWIPFC